MGEIIRFPILGERLTRQVSNVIDASERWDRAAEALSRRDYDGFDRIMGKRAYAPSNGDAA